MAGQTIDYDALDRQARGLPPAAPAPSLGPPGGKQPIDYAALAKQAGAIDSAPPPEGPGAVSRFASGAGDIAKATPQAFSLPPTMTLGGASTGLVDPNLIEGQIQRSKQKLSEAGTALNAPASDPGQMFRNKARAVLSTAEAIPGFGDALSYIEDKVRNKDWAGLAGAGSMIALLHGATKLPENIKLPGVEPRLTPAGTSAVRFAEEQNIPISAATRTGNRAVKNVQGAVANAPGGANVAQQAVENTRARMGQVSQNLAEQVAPGGITTPEGAGAAVTKQLAAAKSSQAQQARGAYARLAAIEQDPANIKPIQTGVKTVQTGVLDQSGQPITRSVPQVEQMAIPVSMGDAKTSLQPIYDRLSQDMPLAQQQASRGLKAIGNIINGPDTLPASIAEDNLGAVKAILRENVNERTKYLAKQAIDALAPQVESAVSSAGPDAIAALREGRKLTAAKYATQATMDQLNVDEPVRLFNQLTQKGDMNISLLRDVQKNAPEALPAVGRATLEGLFDSALNPEGKPGAQTALSSWNKMGDATKRILFRDPKLISKLDNFFQLAKMEAENPNPSGTAYVAGAGLNVLQFVHGLGWVVASPKVGMSMLGTQAAYLIANRALARMLYDPAGSSLLIRGARLPLAPSSGNIAAVTAGQILKLAGKDASPVSLPAAAESEQAKPEESASAKPPLPQMSKGGLVLPGRGLKWHRKLKKLARGGIVGPPATAVPPAPPPQLNAGGAMPPPTPPQNLTPEQYGQAAAAFFRAVIPPPQNQPIMPPPVNVAQSPDWGLKLRRSPYRQPPPKPPATIAIAPSQITK